MFKFMYYITKFFISAVFFMFMGIIFMFVSANYLPRLYTANYYERGCFDGVSNLVILLDIDKIKDKEKIARESCDRSVKNLKTKGGV